MANPLKKLIHQTFNHIPYNSGAIDSVPIPLIFNNRLLPIGDRKYIPILIDGIVVKQFPFILAHPDNVKITIDNDKRLDTSKLKHDSLVILKNEFESQLLLNQNYFDRILSEVYTSIREYLNDEIDFLKDENLSDKDILSIEMFIEHDLIHTLNMISVSGMSFDPESDKKFSVSNGWLRFDETNHKEKSITISDVEFSVSRILEIQKPNFEKIKPILDKSILIYHEYLKVCAKLYDISLDSIIETLQKGKQTGRKPDFDKEYTKELYYKLLENPDYRKKNNTPHLNKIYTEIARLQSEKTGIYNSDISTFRKQIEQIKSIEKKEKGNK